MRRKTVKLSYTALGTLSETMAILRFKELLVSNDGFKRTWILWAMGAILACFAIWGCVERAEIAKTLEAAESQVLVEDARTEAETAADIAKMNAVVELGC